MPPSPVSNHITVVDTFRQAREWVGLTPAHREIIRRLAEIAVENYVREGDRARRHQDDGHEGSVTPWA